MPDMPRTAVPLKTLSQSFEKFTNVFAGAENPNLTLKIYDNINIYQTKSAFYYSKNEKASFENKLLFADQDFNQTQNRVKTRKRINQTHFFLQNYCDQTTVFSHSDLFSKKR